MKLSSVTIYIESDLTSWSYMAWKAANENNLPAERVDSSSVGNLMPVDLEDYQQKRLDEGRAFATIDMEIKIAQTMVTT